MTEARSSSSTPRDRAGWSWSERRAGLRRRRAYRTGAIVILAFGVLLAVAGYRVYQIARDLTAAREQFDTVETLLKAGQPSQARAALAVGAGHVRHANSTLHASPELSLLSLVPVARQNIRAMRESVGIALALSTSGGSLLDAARPLENSAGQFEVPMRSGAVPLDVINKLRPRLRELSNLLPYETEARNSRVLVPVVRKLEKAIYRQAGLRKTQTATLAAGLDTLATLSGSSRDRRFLIAVANAAEMRGTGGMILAYGQLTSTAGKFSLDKFGGIDDLVLKDAAPVPEGTPADYLKRFNELGPTLNWRNANMGGDFTYTGPVLEAMFDKATGRKADGVIQIDSMGLAALMKGTGPVEVEGLGQVTADNVVQVTLSEAYNRFPNERTERQEVLGDVAEAVFRKLVTGDYPSLRPLATAVVQAALERRMLLHMSEPVDQRQVGALGIDGRLPGSGLDMAALTVQNFAGNKLDYYLDTALALRGDRLAGSLGRVQAEITLTNTAPPDRLTPAYVFGPFNRALKPGQYVGLVSLYLPQGSSLRGSRGDTGEGAPALATEADRSVVAFPVRVDAGKSIRIVLDLELPPAAGKGYALVLAPISRVRPTTVTVDLTRAPDKHLTLSKKLTQFEVLTD